MFDYAKQLLVGVLAVGAGATVWAQGGAANPNGAMTLDVVVAPKSGVGVRGLPAGAFTLLDNGQPRPIQSVQEVGSTAPVQVVLVVDAVNARYSTVAYAREELKKYLLANGGKLEHPTRLAVVMDKGVQLQDHASTDGTMLDAVLEKDVIGLREIGRSGGVYGAQERLDDSLNSFNVLMTKLKTEPGRKLVIYVSPGWPLISGPAVQLSQKQENAIFASIITASAAMREAKVTLYNVNPVGAGENLVRTDYYQSFLKGQTDPKRVELGDLGLQLFAVQSGGVVDELTNGVAEAITRDVRDVDDSYVLTFAPAESDGNAEYHSIQVNVTGGVVARTRTSYYTSAGKP